MRWLIASKPHKCSACGAPINVNDEYLGNSYSAFCKPCGIQKEEGKLVYSSKAKKHVPAGEIVDTSFCNYCMEPPVGEMFGIPVCAKHAAYPKNKDGDTELPPEASTDG